MGEEITRLYKPEMGGGGLLDIGIYMLALASWVYGSPRPDHADVAIHKHPSGVDAMGIINLKCGACLACGMCRVGVQGMPGLLNSQVRNGVQRRACCSCAGRV